MEAYQRAPNPPVDDALRAAAHKALHAIEPDGTLHTASRAMLFVFRGLGWRISTTVAGTPPLSWGCELGYQLFARNRSFFSKFVFWKPHPSVADF